MADRLIGDYAVSGGKYLNTPEQIRNRAQELLVTEEHVYRLVGSDWTNFQANIEQACRVFEATIGVDGSYPEVA